MTPAGSSASTASGIISCAVTQTMHPAAALISQGRAACTQPAAAPQLDLDELLIDEDAAFTIHQCLHRLEEPYKEVFTLRVFGELSYEKIGAIFGHTANWACVTYCRAKRKIQQMLKEA